MPAVEHVAMVADNRVNVWTKRVMRQPPGVRELSRLLYACNQSVQCRGPIPTSYKRTVSGFVSGLPHHQLRGYLFADIALRKRGQGRSADEGGEMEGRRVINELKHLSHIKKVS